MKRFSTINLFYFNINNIISTNYLKNYQKNYLKNYQKITKKIAKINIINYGHFFGNLIFGNFIGHFYGNL